MNSIHAVLEKIHGGDIDALGDLYDFFADELYHVGIQYIKDESWVEDQIHDLFLDFFRSRKNIPKIRNIRAYLTTSLKRRLYKRNKVKELCTEDDGFEQILRTFPNYVEASPELKWMDSEHSDHLKGSLKLAMDSLTNHQQNALHMRFTENKSYDEIAEQMDVSVASARTLLYRSVKILREKMHFLFH